MTLVPAGTKKTKQMVLLVGTKKAKKTKHMALLLAGTKKTKQMAVCWYMGMQEEQRVPRLINFLPEPEHSTIRDETSDEEVIAETFEETTDSQDTASGSRINNKRKSPSQQPELPSNLKGVADDSSLCGDNNAEGSANMGMQEEQRPPPRLINFLPEHSTIWGETADEEEVIAETVEETTESQVAVDTDLHLFTC